MRRNFLLFGSVFLRWYAGGECVPEGIECEGPILCDALAPTCPEGQVPQVEGYCYGECVSVKSCGFLSDCGLCDALGLACLKIHDES